MAVVDPFALDMSGAGAQAAANAGGTATAQPWWQTLDWGGVSKGLGAFSRGLGGSDAGTVGQTYTGQSSGGASVGVHRGQFTPVPLQSASRPMLDIQTLQQILASRGTRL